MPRAKQALINLMEQCWSVTQRPTLAMILSQLDDCAGPGSSSFMFFGDGENDEDDDLNVLSASEGISKRSMNDGFDWQNKWENISKQLQYACTKSKISFFINFSFF